MRVAVRRSAPWCLMLTAMLSSAMLVALPHHPVDAAPWALIPTTDIGVVNAVGLTAGLSPVYVATDRGLYRSASSTYTVWTKQSSLVDIVALSPNPQHPDDLIFTRKPYPEQGSGTYRSTDGGRTAQLVAACPLASLARSPSSFETLYGTASECPADLYPSFAEDRVARSVDDGVTWTTVYTREDGGEYPGSFGPVVIAPTYPARILFSNIYGRLTGDLWGSNDAGQTWSLSLSIPADYRFPESIAINPRQPAQVWSVWGEAGLYQSRDGGQTWQQKTIVGFRMKPDDYPQDASRPDSVLSGTAFNSVRADPLSGRIYIGAVDYIGAAPWPTEVFSLDAQGHVDHFTDLDGIAGPTPEVTRNGIILSWCHNWCDAVQPLGTPLAARPLIASGNWAVSAYLPVAAHAATRLLGQPLSPTAMCDGSPCQYFDKGAVETQGYQGYGFVALVPRLIGARSSLPVGGGTSTVTYRTLYALHGQCTPMPAGFHGGTLAMPGGTYVPYSPTLAPASGYVVPTVFWRYLNDHASAPDGWQQDMGLPLTPAVSATVTKGKLGSRVILVQAFQRAILTYDPRNAAPFQVERANIGADYAALFPAAVR